MLEDIPRTNRIVQFFEKKKFYLKKIAPLFLLAIPLLAGILIVRNINKRTNLKPKASSVRGSGKSPINYTGLFAEQVLLELNNPCQVNKYLDNNRVAKNIANCQMPSFVSFNGSSYQINQTGGIIIDNPAKDLPFYRIDFVLEDDGISEQASLVTVLDALWQEGVNLGVSVGVDADLSEGRGSRNAYWWHHTDIPLLFNLGVYQTMSPEKIAFDKKVLNQFVRRRQGEIPISIYVTPKGTYATIDGVNLASLPNFWASSYLFTKIGSYKYIVLAKWSANNIPAKFKNLKIVKLPQAPTNAEGVNAYFTKKAMENPEYSDPSTITSTIVGNGTRSFQTFYWLAFYWRAYDYYFWTDHRDLVQKYVDEGNKMMSTYLDNELIRYGKESTLNVNHSLINMNHWFTALSGFFQDYLREDQKQLLQISAARLIDTSSLYLNPNDNSALRFPLDNNPSNPPGVRGWYINDSFSEEISWIENLYTNYLRFFDDGFRQKRLEDYVNFLAFHSHSTGDSLANKYGSSFQFNLLDESYKNFWSKYVHDDYSMDNHSFHPSAHYGGGATLGSQNIAKIMQELGLRYDFLDLTLNGMFTKHFGLVNVDTLRLTTPLPFINMDSSIFYPVDRVNVDAKGIITAYWGQSDPSRVEDWGSLYTEYPGFINAGQEAKGLQQALSTYYLLYPGSGIFFGPEVVLKGNSYNLFTGMAYHSFMYPGRIDLAFGKIGGSNIVTLIDDNVVNPKVVNASQVYNYQARIQSTRSISGVKVKVANASANDKVWTDIATPACSGDACDATWTYTPPNSVGNYYLRVDIDFTDGTKCVADPYKTDYTSQIGFCGVGGFMAFRVVPGGVIQPPPTPPATGCSPINITRVFKWYSNIVIKGPCLGGAGKTVNVAITYPPNASYSGKHLVVSEPPKEVIYIPRTAIPNWNISRGSYQITITPLSSTASQPAPTSVPGSSGDKVIPEAVREIFERWKREMGD